VKAAIAGMALAALAVAQGAGGALAGDTYQFLRLDKSLVKWGAPEQGTGARVSYAFVTETTKFAGARNCQEMQQPGALLASAKIAPATFAHEVEAAFAMWAEVADISFYKVDDPKKAQILIGAQTVDKGTAFANVKYQIAGADAVTGGTGDVRTIQQSLVCLNPSRSWKVGFQGDPAAYDVRYTLTHEIGHAIGLDHPGAHGQLMAFTYQENFRNLQDGDIAGVTALYGAAHRAPAIVAGDDKTKLALAPGTPQPARN
jgi:hypothetical protein